MVTAVQAREQLSRDMGDYFTGTTSATGLSDGRTLVDARLIEEREEDFLRRRTFVVLPDGPSGSGSAEERRVQRIIEPAGELHFLRAFTAQVANSNSYEVHTHFRGADKDEAVNQALDLLGGTILFTEATSDISLVAEQFDYSISSLGFYKNELHQVHGISDNDTEVTTEMFDWEVRGTDLHLLTLPTVPSSGRKLRVFGNKKATLSDIGLNSGDLLILSARAAMILYETAIAEFPNEAQIWAALHATMSSRFDERIVRHFTTGIAKTEFSEMYRTSDLSDVHWNVV